MRKEIKTKKCSATDDRPFFQHAVRTSSRFCGGRICVRSRSCSRQRRPSPLVCSSNNVIPRNRRTGRSDENHRIARNIGTDGGAGRRQIVEGNFVKKHGPCSVATAERRGINRKIDAPGSELVATNHYQEVFSFRANKERVHYCVQIVVSFRIVGCPVRDRVARALRFDRCKIKYLRNNW